VAATADDFVVPEGESADIEAGSIELEQARSDAARELGDVGSVSALNSADAAAEEQAHAQPLQEVTCSVCLGPIELPLHRGQYMVTPCNHMFHAECLREWMEVKMECPVCRGLLPELGDEVRTH
jgi:hypothetical protein